MGKQMSKTRAVILVIAIFLSNIAYMNDMIIVPAVAQFYEMFPDQTLLVNFIVSGPSLLMMAAMLLSAKLMQKFSKKDLILVGLVIFTLSGVFGILKLNAMYMAIMRAFVGFSTGLISATSVALLSEVFTDEKTRGFVLGLNTATMSALGAVLSLISGHIAVGNWMNVFKLYWIAVPVIALIVLSVPRMKPGLEEVAEKAKTKFPLKNILWLSFSFVMFSTMYSIVYFQISIYVAETGIGNEALAGLLSSVTTIGSAVAAAAFGILYLKIKRFTMCTAFFFAGFSFVLMVIAPSAVLAGVSCAFLGVAFGIAFSCLMMEATVLVPEEHVSTSVSIASAIGCVAMFLSTYFSSFLQFILNVDTLKGIMPVLAGLCIILGVVEAVYTLKKRNGFPAK